MRGIHARNSKVERIIEDNLDFSKIVVVVEITVESACTVDKAEFKDVPSWYGVIQGRQGDGVRLLIATGRQRRDALIGSGHERSIEFSQVPTHVSDQATLTTGMGGTRDAHNVVLFCIKDELTVVCVQA